MLSSLYRSKSISASLLSLAIAPLALIHSPDAGAVDVNNECAAVYGSSFVPVTGKVAATSPTSSRPAKGVITRDPNFKTCVVRATNHTVDAGKSFTRNYYSRRQAFNADNTRFIVFANDNSWHLYDANTLTRLRTLSGLSSDSEAQWDPKDPRTLYYSRDTRLLKLDTETNLSTVATNFTGRLPWGDTAKVWTNWEGSPSADGRYWCFMAEASGGSIRGVFTYDLATQTVLGTRKLSSKPNHVSMSPSGRSCVVAGGDVSGATVAWNSTFTTSRTLYSKSAHSDLALGADGSDNFIFVDYNNNGNLTVVNMDTGVRTALWSIYVNGTATSLHISGKNFSRPGWFLLSTFNLRNGSEQWLHERVMAVEMKANPTIINLAHHHSIYNGYWTQPQASVSRDFSRVLFSTNWGTSSDLDVDAFMVRLPDNLFGGTTTTPTPSPSPTCTRTAPAISLTGPTSAVAAGSTQNYKIGVTNRDSSACSATSFNLARSVPSGWTGNLSTGSVSLSPGASATATLSVTSAGTATAGSYGLGVGASSSVGAAHTANASATYSVAAPTTSTSTCARATPTVTLSGPTGAVAAGSTIKYTMTLRNNDSTCFSAKTFTLSRSIPSGWTGALAASTLKVAPGASGSTTLSVVSTGTAAAGSYGIGVGASSTVGTIHTANASTTYTVAAPVSSSTSTSTTCARATPTVSLSGPTGAVAPGSTIKYTMTLRNNDSTCYSAKTFTLSRVVPSGWTGTLAATTLKVAPGATGSTTLSVKSASTAGTGTYSVRGNVSSTVGTIHTASASANYAVVR